MDQNRALSRIHYDSATEVRKSQPYGAIREDLFWVPFKSTNWGPKGLRSGMKKRNADEEDTTELYFAKIIRALQDSSTEQLTDVKFPPCYSDMEYSQRKLTVELFGDATQRRRSSPQAGADFNENDLLCD